MAGAEVVDGGQIGCGGSVSWRLHEVVGKGGIVVVVLGLSPSFSLLRFEVRQTVQENMGILFPFLFELL